MTTCYIGDALHWMKRLESKTIDFLYINPPFGTTKNEWDTKIDWAEWFKEAYRLIKDDGVIAIHASIPFNYTLIREAPKAPSYSWYWKKEGTTLALCAKVQPMRCMEEILIWKGKKARYYPKRVGTKIGKSGGTYSTSYCNPAGTQKKIDVVGQYQTHLIEMKRNLRGYATRPDEMIKLFLEHYTKEGDTVLDTFTHLGLTGRICKEMNRKFIGIDRNFYPLEIIQHPASSS